MSAKGDDEKGSNHKRSPTPHIMFHFSPIIKRKKLHLPRSRCGIPPRSDYQWLHIAMPCHSTPHPPHTFILHRESPPALIRDAMRLVRVCMDAR